MILRPTVSTFGDSLFMTRYQNLYDSCHEFDPCLTIF